MAKISTALVLLLTFASSQAQFSPPGETAFRKYTLDDIVPATDQASGHIKCCPAGTEFDGKGCVLNVPVCPKGSTRDGDKCIAHTKPSCDAGYDYQNGFCITNKPPTCDHATVLKGNHCVLEGVANCETGYTLQGNVCVTQKPPVCPDGEFFNGKSCTSLKGPKCQDGAKLENGLCIDNNPPSKYHAVQKIPLFKKNNAFRLPDSYVVTEASSILKLNLVLSMGSPSALLEPN
ncbi:hypothetical protein VF21_07618 [Pseudogymnoascus sp. 05NY08]|nr:hypothetical protein VF21_07618 [Pseudogymnoascus sp. 05NY08]